MAQEARFPRVDQDKLERIQEIENPPLGIRWWVLPFAALLCALQSVMNLVFESRGTPVALIAAQISVIAFGFLFGLTLLLNPVLRLTRIVRPLNRAEVIAIFAALFVSAGISSSGLVDQLVPLIATPHNTYWNTNQREWNSLVIPHLNEQLFITDPGRINEFRVGFSTRVGLWNRIPWTLWAKPIALWMIFVFAVYLMFYSLSILLVDAWARREKLTFPLAKLPEDMIHEDDAKPGALPATVRSGFFWGGFLFVFLLLSFKAACQAGWIWGIEPIKLGMDQDQLVTMLSNSVFKGIAVSSGQAPYRLMFIFFFTVIGISYLLPLEISRSLWSYHLLGLGLLLMAIWFAVGASVEAFPTDAVMQNNFVSALGGGGMLAFSSVFLAKVIIDRWAFSREQAAGLGALVRLRCFLSAFGWGGILFLSSAIIAICWLRWSGVPVFWSVAFLCVIVLLTVGLMRVVAEGGVFWFYLHVGPFHVAKVTGVLRRISGAALAPLMCVYAVLFQTIQTCMAPAILNSFKMQEETRASRRKFHLIVITGIVVTAIVAFIAVLYLAYEVGADRSNRSFFGEAAAPRILDDAKQLIKGAFGSADRGMWFFYVAGAAWVFLSIAARRRMFWWPHPIGFVMMANPLMSQMWLSFFIGWLCKKLTVKYGGRHMFAKLRPMFIGLIVGELAACFIWSVLAKTYGLDKVSIDINRTGP